MIETYSEINRRSNQEDLLLVIEKPNYKVLAVIDGMGGHVNGEIAAADLYEWINNFFKGLDDFEPNHLQIFNAIITQSPKNWPDYRGAVATIAVIVDKKLYLLHKGDTRAYLLNNNTCEKLTRDHSYGGGLTACFIKDDLTLCETKELDLSEWDAILLTTDGLHHYHNVDDIYTIYQTSVAGKALENLALSSRKNHCTDNQTGILLYLHDWNN